MGSRSCIICGVGTFPADLCRQCKRNWKGAYKEARALVDKKKADGHPIDIADIAEALHIAFAAGEQREEDQGTKASWWKRIW